MIPRKIAPVLRHRLGSFPAVAMVGPRQCGKTTLARSFGGRYFDLEQESARLRLDLEWDRVATAPELVVLDEAQAWPEVFEWNATAIGKSLALSYHTVNGYLDYLGGRF